MKRYFVEFNNSHIPLCEKFKTLDLQPNECDYFQDYLAYNALLDCKQGLGKTFLFIEEENEDKKIIGFYTLKASSLIINDMYSKEKQGEPAVEIYELAVHKDYQKQGIGTDIIKTIFAQVYELSEKYLGIKHIVVCAKPTAINFYKKFNFKEIDKLVPRTYDNKNCVAMSVRLKFM